MGSKINRLLLKDKKNFHISILENIADENNFLNKTAEVLKNGCEVLEFDGINLNSKNYLAVSKKLRDLCGVFNALLIIKDRIDMAKLSGADGIVLDENSISPQEAHKLTENHLLLGYHVHDEIMPDKKDLDILDFISGKEGINCDIKQFFRN